MKAAPAPPTALWCRPADPRWPWRRGGAALVLALIAGTGGAAAEVIEAVSYKNYPVQPPTGTLREALNSATPVRRDGQSFHASTHWNLRWDLRWYEEPGGGCAVTAATTWLDAEILLPALAAADKETSSRFARYLKSLRAHEDGHVELGRAAAHLLQRRLRELPPAGACALLAARAGQLAREVLDAARRDELAYDRSTGYGHSQGAWLP